MSLVDLPPAVQKLGSIGGSWDEARWPDYRALGITTEHIPALIRLVEQACSFWDDSEADEEDPVFYTPLHAWRALGVLQAIEALPALLDALRLIEECDADMVQDELPDVFAMLGPAAVSPLTGYLLEPEHSMWARIAAAEGLKKIAQQAPEARDDVMRALISTLEGYNVEDETINGFLVAYLMDLKAVEAAPLVEQAFLANRVDESIFGDWEDFQIGIGLLDRRLNARRSRRFSPSFFSDGIDPVEEHSAQAPVNPVYRQQEKKEKNKRKMARAQRKKAHAKKGRKKK